MKDLTQYKTVTYNIYKAVISRSAHNKYSPNSSQGSTWRCHLVRNFSLNFHLVVVVVGALGVSL